MDQPGRQHHSPSRSAKLAACRLAALVAATALAMCAAVAARADEPLVLADGGRSDYVIVLPEKPSPSVRYAAEELQRFLREMSGAELPIVADGASSREQEILLGVDPRTRNLTVDLGGAELGDEGYALQTIGSRLFIVGNATRGVLYGVYGLLSDHLGCRWFTPQVSRIPKKTRVEVGPLKEVRRPALEYREVMLFDCWNADWMARNRVNTTKLPGARHGGAVQFVPDYYVHTFGRLVPVDKYYDAHPEYYSEVDGKRLREANQLCPTNDDVVQIVTERVRELLRQHPEAKVVSVSQNDANKNYCRCARCAALDEREGSHAGQVLYLVNRVAEGIEKQFPDRAVETLAYEWSRKPPKTLRPRDNVIVRLSTIRCSFSEPLGTSELPVNRSFRRDLEGWGAICRRVWVWDYMTYFSYYLLPWPNYRVLDDNVRFFVRNNVRGVVEQSNWQSPHGEMNGLKGYVAAQCLWNPDCDGDRAAQEFLEGVYGPAAPHIRAWLDLLSDKVASEHIAVPIYGSRTPPYLTLDVLQKGDRLWDEAVKAVADQPDLLRRVQIARLPHDYAFIEHYRFKPNEMVKYEGNPRRGKVVGIDPGYEARVRRFLEVSKGSGITHIREGKPDFDDYVKWLESLLPPYDK